MPKIHTEIVGAPFKTKVLIFIGIQSALKKLQDLEWGPIYGNAPVIQKLSTL